MSSGNAYERVFKLWISLWNLVLEDKRQLETVTTTLQRIVFEERGYPHFKNWPEICKLGETDHMLMMAVATIVSYSDDENVQNLIAAFPKCFSYDEVIGPHPLSLMLDEAEKNGAEQGSKNGRDYPFSYDAIPEWIPLQGFDIYGNRRANFDGPKLPEGINPHAQQGEIVEWEGKKFVVLENNDSCEEIWLAPAECVRADL